MKKLLTLIHTYVQTRRRERGFTLVETVVAIFILVLAIGAPLTLAAQSLFGAFVARDQMIASFLAQDAVETIRAQRDNNILEKKDNAFDGNDINKCLTTYGGGYGCYIEVKHDGGAPVKFNLKQCTDAECGGPIGYEPSVGIYGFKNATEETPFTRIIKLEPMSSVNEYKLIVEIKWQIRTLSRSFKVEEIMSDWVNL